MKRFSILLLLYFITLLPVKAQLLYKCESPGGDTTTWVMGTMHWADRKGFREDPVFDSLIAGSDVFFEEPLLKEHLTPEQSLRLQQVQRYENGRTLKDFVSRKELNRLTTELAAQLKLNAITIRRFFGFAPFFMLSKLPPRDSTRHVELDQYLINKARRFNRRIVPLDHPDSIYQTFLVLREKHQPEWLLRAYPHYFKKAGALEMAYRAQDTAAIIPQIGNSADSGYTLLIARRNEQWVKIIERESGRRNFIEAGLAHIIAPTDGLLDYFRRKNWKVSGVKTDLFRN